MNEPYPVIEVGPEHAAVLAMLDAAGGEPVSFAELAERGVERPATLVYELEAAGCSVERVFRSPAGGHKALAGVRRRPAGGSPADQASARAGSRSYPQARSGRVRMWRPGRAT